MGEKIRETVLQAAAYVIMFFVVTTFFQIIEWPEEPKDLPPPSTAPEAQQAKLGTAAGSQLGIGTAVAVA